MVRKTYDVVEPAVRSTGVTFASPHSGADYPWEFLRSSVLDHHLIRSSEDAYVDDLFSGAREAGAPMLRALAPRAYVDLNRAADELDPALIEGVPRSGHNPRVGSGLGVIPRVVANGRVIYRGKLQRTEADRRLQEVWFPYHSALARLLRESHERFGMAILVDCHSMPHEAIDSFAHSGLMRPEVVLGDRFGASAGAHVVDGIETALRRAGLRVARNAPFAGAFTTQHYGRPSRGQHVVQLEIDRSLYMDEKTMEKTANFEPLRALLNTVISEVADLGRPASTEALAAE